MPPVLTYDIGERRDIDVSKEITIPDPDETPFSVIMMRARKQPVDTMEFHWYEQDYLGRWTRIDNAAGYGAADAVLKVADASIFTPKDLVDVAGQGEIMRVTAVDTTANTISVIRAYAGVAVNLPNNTELMRLSIAMEENSLAPESNLRQPVKRYNLCQTIRTTFDESMSSADEPKKAGPRERTRLRRLKAVEHRRDIEHVLIFGQRKEDVPNKVRTTGGILYFVQTNIKDLAGQPLTETEWDDFCRMLFAHGSSKKVVVASGTVMQAVDGFAKGKLQTVVGKETYGVHLSEYISTYGRVYLAYSKVLTNAYSGMAIGLDMSHIYYRPKRGTTLRANIQENDRDGWKDEYLTEFGLKVEQETCHAVLKGVA